MKILIKVTKDVLFKSRFCSTSICDVTENCAIAVAVRDIFPDAQVTLSTLYFNKINPSQYAKLPMRATMFIADFDSKGENARIKMPEFSFEINVPSSVVDSIGIGECYRVLSESRTLELVHP